jgi:hypothetical protein
VHSPRRWKHHYPGCLSFFAYTVVHKCRWNGCWFSMLVLWPDSLFRFLANHLLARYNLKKSLRSIFCWLDQRNGQSGCYAAGSTNKMDRVLSMCTNRWNCVWIDDWTSRFIIPLYLHLPYICLTFAVHIHHIIQVKPSNMFSGIVAGQSNTIFSGWHS